MSQVIKSLGTASIVLLCAASLLHLFGKTNAAVFLATITGMLWVLLVLAAVWGAGSWWTAKTMERGAEIALKAQQINDSWDAKKTSALAGVFTSGVKLAQQHQPVSLPGDLPSLPLPDQDLGWLPPLESFSLVDGDFSEIEGEQ